MKVLVSCILVLLAVSCVLAANPGEEGGYCKGILNLPVLLTSCRQECGIPSILPLINCNGELKCCLTQKQPPSEPEPSPSPAPAPTE